MVVRAAAKLTLNPTIPSEIRVRLMECYLNSCIKHIRTCEQDFEVEQHIERILTDFKKKILQDLKNFDELYLCNYSMDFGS